MQLILYFDNWRAQVQEDLEVAVDEGDPFG